MGRFGRTAAHRVADLEGPAVDRKPSPSEQHQPALLRKAALVSAVALVKHHPRRLDSRCAPRLCRRSASQRLLLKPRYPAASTASATEAMRAPAESAREVTTTGTRAPSTKPAQSPPPT